MRPIARRTTPITAHGRDARATRDRMRTDGSHMHGALGMPLMPGWPGCRFRRAVGGIGVASRPGHGIFPAVLRRFP